MTAGKVSRPPVLIGAVGVSCAVLGLFAWLGNGALVMMAIRAVFSHDSRVSNRALMYAGGFALTQLLLGISAMILGWASLARGSNLRVNKTLGHVALWTGVVVLMLLFLIP